MIKNILKGFIIGIGKIIPGVSGSMLAILMGVYEKALGIISNLKEMRFNDFIFITSLAFGVFISISLFSQGVNWLLKNYYFWTLLLFIGLISSGIPDIVKLTFPHKKEKNVNIKYIIVIVLSFLGAFILTKLGESSLTTNTDLTTIISDIDMSIGNIIIIYFIGLLEAFSSIIPGISGTAIFMSLGLYGLLLSLYESILNPAYILWTITFFLGIITGILILAKFITFMLNKYKRLTYSIVLGFILSSVAIMIMMVFKDMPLNNLSLLGYIFLFIKCILIFIVGYILGIKINVLLSKG